MTKTVIPASRSITNMAGTYPLGTKAGIQSQPFFKKFVAYWTPAFAGVTALILVSLSYADSPPILQGRLIVLDPGHGTINYDGSVINPGKTSWSGTQERRVAMSVAQKLGALLEKEGASVVYTRTPADFWRDSYNVAEDNKARAYVANKIGAHAYIAIHCDWDPRSRVHGVTTYYYKENSRKLGAEIQRNMVKDLGAKNRQLIRDTYTVLDIANMPAVIVETGFLSNGSEARKLATPNYQDKVAMALLKGIKGYFGDIGALTTP
jgi:N-acetylmuramoyl-L-alanine amidase